MCRLLCIQLLLAHGDGLAGGHGVPGASGHGVPGAPYHGVPGAPYHGVPGAPGNGVYAHGVPQNMNGAAVSPGAAELMREPSTRRGRRHLIGHPMGEARHTWGDGYHRWLDTESTKEVRGVDARTMKPIVVDM